jgi:hypothetical protein
MVWELPQQLWKPSKVTWKLEESAEPILSGRLFIEIPFDEI